MATDKRDLFKLVLTYDLSSVPLVIIAGNIGLSHHRAVDSEVISSGLCCTVTLLELS